MCRGHHTIDSENKKPMLSLKILRYEVGNSNICFILAETTIKMYFLFIILHIYLHEDIKQLLSMAHAKNEKNKYKLYGWRLENVNIFLVREIGCRSLKFVM